MSKSSLSKRAPSTEDEEMTSKRRRIALACSACRTSKSRCDGARPKCGLCRDLGFECMYVQAASSSNAIVGKEYLASLEDRVQSIEDTLSGFRTSIDELNKHVGRTDESRSSPDRTTNIGSDQMMEPDTFAGDDQIDEVFALGDGYTAIEKETGFFGASSNVAFLRHIANATSRVKKIGQMPTPDSNDESDHLDGRMLQISRVTSPMRQVFHAEPVEVFKLPSEEKVLHLIDIYFKDPGFLYPMLHKPKFLKTYHLMKKRNPREIPRTWLGLLNIVMTMATATFPSPKETTDAGERIEEAEQYYKRGVVLCQRPMMRGSSVEIVQFLLIATMYLQGSQKSIEAWTTHGLAVKAALQLGLHSKSVAKKFSGLQLEMRKRAWFVCVLVDRTLSVTFGRPATIPDSYVQLHLLEPFRGEGEPVPGSPLEDQDSTIFMNMTITLYRFIWKVIDALYGQNLGCSDPLPLSECASTIIRIDQELLEWERSLPRHLCLRSSEVVSIDLLNSPVGLVTQTDERMSILLTLQYHNIRLLLHRPILTSYLDLCPNGTPRVTDAAVLQQVGATSITINLHSAGEIINIIYAGAQSVEKRGTLGAWWFSLYYTFNAALVIYASLLVCRNRQSPSVEDRLKQSAKASLYKAVDLLAILDKGNVLVGRCASYLRPLVSFITSLTPPSEPALENPSLNYAALTDPTNSVYQGFSLPVYEPSQFAMDFGEFMLPSDIDWMNSSFGPPAPLPAQNMPGADPNEYAGVWDGGVGV